ncbi:MAG: aldolase/citrate lyase family protein [Candidatus Eremiobacteraeota bacterium]|nr:aldolase/citrate lyase family protein [Candidatus Eremiobacteraeota bacterium]
MSLIFSNIPSLIYKFYVTGGAIVIHLKNKLAAREYSPGSWITLAHTSIAEIMARAGFEWLTVDMEHSAISLPEAQQLIQVIGLCGAVPLVRVGENNSLLIKRVMDAGAGGIIVPMVNSKEDAKRAVASVHYPPSGKRGVGLARAQGYGLDFPAYKAWVDRESIIIVQIEHIDAIKNLEEILATPGVDGSIIGPYDLSGSLGYPGEFERVEVKEALHTYEHICTLMKKPMGFHIVQPDASKVAHYREKNYSFIAVGLDTLYLAEKCREVLARSAPSHE